MTLPVVPGTAHVTLGGMVAADVHGKNHATHGTIGRHVRAILLRTADGTVREVSRGSEPELFHATVGGMGLTGAILEVECDLERVPAAHFITRFPVIAGPQELVDRLAAADPAWPFRVAWVDLLARGRGFAKGVLHEGRWARPDDPVPDRPARRRTRRVRWSPALPRWAVRAWNGAYGRQHGSAATRAMQPSAFLFPLDRVTNWNLLYGTRGFVQHQVVFPRAEGLLAYLQTVRRRDVPAYLAVIKDLGDEGEGLLGFPRRGWTIAIDMPRRRRTQADVDALNEVVLAHGGRMYLAKDALTRREHYVAMEPRLPAFEAVRRRWDPERRIRSALSVRLFEEAP